MKTAKDELYEKTQEEYGVDLDRRLSLMDLEEQVVKLKKEKDNPTPKPKIRRPKTVRNIFTQHVFAYSPLFGNNSDLEVIEWEDDDGDN